MDYQGIRNATALGMHLFSFDLKERYAGTFLGMLWLVIHPLFMLLIYAFIFGEVLQLRSGASHSTPQFALYLFTGLLAFNAVSEVLVRAPSLLNDRRDLLLNTPLPVWLLPLLPVAVSVVLEVLALLVLLVALSVQNELKISGVFFYFYFLIIRIIFSLAGAYVIAVLGVFVRDLRQLMPVLMTVLLFVSPILYPPEVIPEQFLFFYDWNLLGQLVQGYREALLDGIINWGRFSVLFLISISCLSLAIWLFRSLMPRARYVL
ncbi:MAG: Transport permease protein [uncultured Thiotrichaceae bacterium]|uniref:Transport permease protein n=1 Tax=uncultured Thiotrichaceae bacterium TaxID=298394 RepID=A0A6S6TK62_9GAMM|nr:MAG: Transport permease protein [uncultured Thiotrichaceae bacterium]